MSLNESIVEDAALILPMATLTRPLPRGEEWELGYTVGHGPHLAPGGYAGGTPTPARSQGERESYGEVVLAGRLREAIRRLNSGIPQSHTLATLRDTLLPKLLSGELSVAAATGKRDLQVQTDGR